MGTALLVIGDLATGTLASQAQSALPAVTVDAPTPARRASSVRAAPARRAQAIAARRPSRNTTPAQPTPSERAIAAAAAKYEAILGYRAMPNATTLRGATSPLNTSQVVNVVPQQVISDQRPRNLDDALINVSGITQGNTLAGTQDAVMRRGFGDNRDGSIMRNGMPINQGRALNAAVESVEVLKGPASLLYGIMDPGGIINTISKRPELYQHGEITVEGSTFGSKGGGNVTADVTGPIGADGLAYRLIAYDINEDYWRNFGTRQETLFAPSLAWYGDNTTVHLNYEHRDFSSPFDRGIALDPRTNAPLAGVPITRRFDEPYNSMWGTSDLLQASVDHRINENWKLYAGYSYNTESYTANQLRISAINPVTGVLTRSNDGTGGALTQVSYGTSYMQGTVWLGGFKNEVVFGGDAEYRVIYRKDLIRQAVATQNIFNPVYDRQGPGTTISASDSDQTDKLGTRSLFAQDTLHLTNWLALVGGVRWMEYEQIAGRGRPFVTNTNTAGDKVLPLGGVIFKLNDQISLYASYTESLKPSWTIAPLASIITSNLAPEEGVSYEGGVKFDFNKRLSGSIAFYDLNKKNVLVSLFDVGTGTNGLRPAGPARSRGVEIDVTGRLTDSISTIATYAYTDARVTADPLLNGNGLQNVALNTGSLFVVYDFRDTLPGGRLRVGAGARYVGDRPGDAENTFILPEYTVADAFVTYDTRYNNVPVIYQFNIKNMFDNVYFPSAVNKLNVVLGDARRFSLAATVKF